MPRNQRFRPYRRAPLPWVTRGIATLAQFSHRTVSSNRGAELAFARTGLAIGPARLTYSREREVV